jgi:hypothetical protein
MGERGVAQYLPIVLAINFLSVANTKDKHDKTIVFNFANEPVFADAVPPELP